MGILERIWTWRNAFAEEQRRRPSRDEVERRAALREQQQRDRFEDEVARLVALRGSWLPGDGDEPRQPQVTPREGHWDGGPFSGFVRW